MIKSYPGHSPLAKPLNGNPPTGTPMAAPTGDAVPRIFTGTFASLRAGDTLDQRESPTRRAHRLHMKEFFSQANSAS